MLASINFNYCNCIFPPTKKITFILRRITKFFDVLRYSSAETMEISCNCVRPVIRWCEKVSVAFQRVRAGRGIKAKIEMHVWHERYTHGSFNRQPSALVRDLFTTTPCEVVDWRGNLLSLKGGMIVRVLVKRGIIFYRYTCMCKSLESSICYSSNFCTRISMCMPYVTAYKYMKYGNAFRKFLSFGFYCNQNLEVLSSKKQIPRKMYRFHDSIEFHFLFFNALVLQSLL